MRNLILDASSFRRSAIATLAAAAMAAAPAAHSAALSNDARTAIPRDVQQIIMVDYRAMQNSPAALSLKDRIMPPELKRLEQALVSSGLKVESDTDALAFTSFRAPSPDGKGGQVERIVGIAQGQFRTRDILANLTKSKAKFDKRRNNNIYPMGASGFEVSFVNPTTMVFGDRDAIYAALDARDGFAPSFLTNSDMVNEMAQVETHAIWSLLDPKGTQAMMKSVLGDAAQLTDYDTVRNRIGDSHYTMDFSNGVRFAMTVDLSDSFTAATASTLMKGVAMLRKQQGSSMEKSAIDETTISSSGGKLSVDYSSSDSEFASLLTSPLFQSVVK